MRLLFSFCVKVFFCVCVYPQQGWWRREAKLNKTEGKALYYRTKTQLLTAKWTKLTLNLFLGAVARNGKLLPNRFAAARMRERDWMGSWGRKVCDNLASKRDTESISSETSDTESTGLVYYTNLENTQIRGLLMCHISMWTPELSCGDLVRLESTRVRNPI